METWRAIPGYEGAYEASDFGRIRNIRSGRVLKPWKHPRGYVAVTLSLDAAKTKFTAHSLIMLTFVGPRPAGMEVCHGNGIKTDNRLLNLRYDTPAGNRAENVYDRGEHHSHAKLTEAAVREIKASKGASPTVLARRFGVSRGAVNGVLRGHNWSWVQ